MLGLSLVLLILAVFLEFRLAIWVAMGIPISFFGAMILLPMLGVSINMISSFAFILALGIVVDDAIVVGENIHAHRMMGKSKYQAAVDGVHEVMGAVTFSVLTTITAFVPILYVEGTLKFFMSVIPLVVISVLLISLVESFFILPAHLNSNGKIDGKKRKTFGIRIKIRAGLDYFINVIYGNFMIRVLNYRYVTIAVFVGSLIVTFGYIKSGNMKFTFMPRIERDVIYVSVKMPAGTNIEKMNSVIEHINQNARKTDKMLREETGFKDSYLDFVLTGASSGKSGWARVTLIPSEERDINTGKFEMLLRKNVGQVKGVDSLTFTSQGLRFGANINVRYAHYDQDVLVAVLEELKEKLKSYEGVIDIDDTFDRGKNELLFKVNELGRKYGLTNNEVGRQVRAAYNGVTALKFQRDLDEVTVRVEYPDREKKGIDNLMNMYIKTATGMEIPFYMVADIEMGRGLATINRTDRKQVVNMTASTEGAANPKEIMGGSG